MIEAAIEAARMAGQVLIDYFGELNTVNLKANKVGETQFVSEVDSKSEQAIVQYISSHHPTHNFLLEEMGEIQKKSEYTWIIDGIDGTTQYIRRLPFFSISIALVQNQEVVLGVVYNPILDEMFSAERGSGAFLNGRRIKVTNFNNLKSTLVSSSTFGSYVAADCKEVFSEVMRQFRNVRIYGSPAMDLCYVGDGRFDARITPNTEPWDHSAACLIVEEADGIVTDWQGKVWSPYSRQIVATNGLLHEYILKFLA